MDKQRETDAPTTLFARADILTKGAYAEYIHRIFIVFSR